MSTTDFGEEELTSIILSKMVNVDSELGFLFSYKHICVIELLQILVR